MYDRVILDPELLKQVDDLRNKASANKEKTELQSGDVILLKKPCPGCCQAVLGYWKHSFQCKNCGLEFRYNRK